MLAGAAFLVTAGAAMVGLAAALLVLSAGRRASRTFAYLLLLMGAALAVNFSRFLWPDPGWAALVLRVNPYLLIPIPLVMAYFGMVYPRPRGPLATTRWGPWAVALAVVGVEVLLLVDRAWYAQPFRDAAGVPVLDAPLRILHWFDVPVAAVLGLVFARDYVRARGDQTGRVSLLLVSVGFGLYAFYAAMRSLLFLTTGIAEVSGNLGANALSWLLWPPFLAVSGATVATLWRHAATSGDPAERRRCRRAGLVLLAAPAATGLSVGLAAVYADPLQNPLWGVFPGVFNLALPVLGAYALLRHRLFGIDLQLKRTIRQSTAVSVFIGVLLLTSQLARGVLDPDAAMALGVLATGALVLALARVQRFADGVAERALPGVREDPAYLDRRKVEVYRAALEQALEGRAAPGPGEAAVLASLRAQLGLTDRDHALLEHAIRGARDGPGAGGPALEPGEVLLGRYRVRRRLGEGAHGVTALAEDLQLQRAVVVKALRPERAGDPAVLREARAIAAIRHPSVVTVFDVERLGDRAYIVMEHLEGGSLQDRLRRGALGAEEFARVAGGLLAALEAVHARGIVHRDVKPSNVLLTPEGEAKLADFGVAHQPGAETTAGGSGGGAAVGTARYMSPEQAKGRQVTARSDLFSAAATLWEARTGAPLLAPRPGESAVEVQMRAAAGRPFRAPRGTPAALARWFARGLHPDPARRFGSAAEMAAALREATGEAPTGGRTRGGTARPR